MHDVSNDTESSNGARSASQVMSPNPTQPAQEPQLAASSGNGGNAQRQNDLRSAAASYGQLSTPPQRSRTLAYGQPPARPQAHASVEEEEIGSESAAQDHEMPRLETVTKFDVGKKLSQPSEYPTWRMRVMAGMGMSRLEQLVQGYEPYDDRWSEAQKNSWDSRRRKAQGLLVSCISDEVLLRYEEIVFQADPIQLWERIYQDFGRGPGVNTDMVMAELYARKLQPDEAVEAYIKDLLRMQRILAENNDPIADSRVARLMLTNAMNVYPKITDDVTRRGMEPHDFTIYASRAELVNAEMTARARQQHSSAASGGQGLTNGRPQLQANFTQRGGKGKKPRQRGGKYGSYRGGSNSNASTTSSRSTAIAERKKNTCCNVCGQRGHWKGDKECSGAPQQAAGSEDTSNRRVQSFAGGVLISKTCGGAAHQPAQVESSFTFDEVQAILGKRAANQLRQELESKYSPPEEQHSPTSTPPDSPSSLRGGLAAVSLVNYQRGVTSQLAADEMEWLLDSGSQINLCGDLSCFSSVEHGDSGDLKTALGQTETLTAHGSVVMKVFNELSGQWEQRRLDEVHYSPNAHVNLMSLGYMQMCGFAANFSSDQCTVWLTKTGTKLRFDRLDKLYRMRVKRSFQLVAAVEDRKNTMGLLHNRLGHVNMKTIRELASSGVDFGLNVNVKSLAAYDCLPCITAKLKRMTYKRNPERRQNPLEKLSVDICSINQQTITKESMFLLVVDEATRYKWCYLLRNKSDAADKIMTLVLRLNTSFQQDHRKVVTLHSDQGGEFLSNKLIAFCAEQGISMQQTNAYSPEENSIVERANGLVLPRLRAVLHAARQSNLLWGEEALLHVIDTVNKLPTTALKGKSPY